MSHSKTVLVPIAQGFEEIETMAIVDILRRAGAKVVLAGVGAFPVVGRSGVSLNPDATIDEALKTAPYDAVVLPGGLPNAFTLRDDPRIKSAVRGHAEQNKLVGAICAAPLALQSAGVLEGHKATSHPGAKDAMALPGYCDDSVVVSGRVVTSRAPGTALKFAFALVQQLYGDEMVAKVNEEVLASL
jgi:4-methyl-5(b-hydroxyethyl)-thiazole monophosphate biosynthesis